jgi:hypothetical protein
VWIGDGENEASRMCSVRRIQEDVEAVPRKRRITTKEESLTTANDGECGSYVVTMFVEIYC